MAELLTFLDDEKCPWCGESAPDEVGVGDKVDIVKYECWLEEHVTACEPWLRESALEGV